MEERIPESKNAVRGLGVPGVPYGVLNHKQQPPSRGAGNPACGDGSLSFGRLFRFVRCATVEIMAPLLTSSTPNYSHLHWSFLSSDHLLSMVDLNIRHPKAEVNEVGQ
jgi:hypothetical protein